MRGEPREGRAPAGHDSVAQLLPLVGIASLERFTLMMSWCCVICARVCPSASLTAEGCNLSPNGPPNAGLATSPAFGHRLGPALVSLDRRPQTFTRRALASRRGEVSKVETIAIASRGPFQPSSETIRRDFTTAASATISHARDAQMDDRPQARSFDSHINLAPRLGGLRMSRDQLEAR